MNNNLDNREEEVNLGDLFVLIKKGFQKIEYSFLRFVNFIFKQAIVLISIILVGALIGYFIQKNSVKMLKTEVIVAADFGSSEYLYKSIEELQYKINLSDQNTLKMLNITTDISGLKIKIDPIINIDELTNSEEQYYRTFTESSFIKEELKKSMITRLSKFYKITLIHPKNIDSRIFLEQMLTSLKNNEYYNEVYKLNSKKIDFLINSNEFLISQIDSLILNYSRESKIKDSQNSSINFTNNVSDLGEVVGNRKDLVQELNELYENKVATQELFKVVDLGYPTEINNKTITSYKTVLIPLLLVLVYFAFIILSKVIIKARKLNK